MTINVTRSSMPPFEEYCEEIRELWDSHWLTNLEASFWWNLWAHLGGSDIHLYKHHEYHKKSLTEESGA